MKKVELTMIRELEKVIENAYNNAFRPHGTWAEQSKHEQYIITKFAESLLKEYFKRHLGIES